jgi:hypothetical protein
MRVGIALAVAIGGASATADAQISIHKEFSASMAIECAAFVPPQTEATFYVLAHPISTGISGAEFSIRGLPPPSAGWSMMATLNPAAVAVGDPFQGGVSIAFESCQSGSYWDPILLYTIQVANVSDTNDYDLSIGPRDPPSDSRFGCASLAGCDDEFTRVCAPSSFPFFLNASGARVHPPRAPEPADGATGVRTDATLAWAEQTGRCACFLGHWNHVVYFGIEPDPPLVNDNHIPFQYSPGSLAPNTRYYWRVVFGDSYCGSASGPVWSFTTGPTVAAQPLRWTAVKQIFR